MNYIKVHFDWDEPEEFQHMFDELQMKGFRECVDGNFYSTQQPAEGMANFLRRIIRDATISVAWEVSEMKPAETELQKKLTPWSQELGIFDPYWKTK